MEDLYMPDCIRTFTGKYINVFEPTLDMIDIEDISHALSNIGRFGGHLPEFYSVAQHCCLCAYLVPEEHKLAALLHDSTEAYMMDIPSPIKKRLNDYKNLEDKLMSAISEKFGFEYPLNSVIKECDHKMLELEWNNLMLGNSTESELDFTCWSSKVAKKKFIDMYNNIT